MEFRKVTPNEYVIFHEKVTRLLQVHNALDAGATSIAVRVNIQENTIQVIDNGCGISSKDITPLGHKYMSSKFIDLATLKSVPNKYGFRGQALACLINVSNSVKLISRHEKSEETWLKLFEHGQEKKIEKCNPRPSKGTTVEVTGFLYNLKIQNKSKDTLYNVQSIKTFLEHISLVHCNVSLSLRDDSKNEILFKIHKNRNVPQTLSTLYNIEKKNLQELQVEKNEYKVTAHISKSDSEVEKQLIFLNGKLIISSSKLHKVVNSNLSKYFNQRGVKKSKIKDKIINENHLIQKSIPDYFIFLKCPYTDYELSNSPKQSVLEFKDWDKINILLDKLIKFYNGDIKLEEITKKKQIQTNKSENSNTREQVKKIMERILGANTKKIGVLNLRNGIQGKQVKRKSKKKSKKSASEVTNNEKKHTDKLTNYNIAIGNSFNNDVYSNVFNRDNDAFNKSSDSPNQSVGNKKYLTMDRTKTNLGKSVGNNYNTYFKKVADKNRTLVGNEMETKQQNMDKKIRKTKISRHKKCVLQSPSDSVKKRCDELHRKTMLMLEQWHKNNLNMIRNKTHEINNHAKNQKNVSVRRQIDEIIIHNNKSKQPRMELVKVNEKLVQSNYDLLQTILKSQEDNTQKVNITSGIWYDMGDKLQFPVAPKKTKNVAHKVETKLKNHTRPNKDLEIKLTEPITTYESHNYYARKSVHTENNSSFHSHVQIHKGKRTFITKQSRENFVMPNECPKRNTFKRKNIRTTISNTIRAHIKNLFKQTSELFNLKKQIIGATCESSYTIEFTESNKRSINDKPIMSLLSQNPRSSIEKIRSQSVNHNNAAKDNDLVAINSSTYVLPHIDNDGYTINNKDYNNWNFYETYDIERTDEFINNNESQYQVAKSNESVQNNRNFIFVSKSQEHDEYNETIEPLNVCETILNSNEAMDREVEISFKNRSNCLFNNVEEANKQDSMYQNICTEENEEIQDILEELRLNDDCQNMITEVSHHFGCPNIFKEPTDLNEAKSSSTNLDDNRPNIQVAELNKTSDLNNANKKSPVLTFKPNVYNNSNFVHVYKNEGESTGDFNFTNRLCFVPKGLSPIFQNSKTKNVCEYNLSRDYYKKELYNNFVENIRNNAGVFEPRIQGANEINTTKAVGKVNIKLVKDKSALKFDGESLKDAKVFGQIDNKFIAATMKEKGNNRLDYLVLFDQHAVHERIRVENNLEDYFKENQWKPVPTDEVTLKLSKDDILYLHNFRDKFEQLGLKWTVLNGDEISISSIPEAILGKNSRQVDKVIRAVRNLIAEEINILNMQGGCLSLYPKSIMDLVFSEACRYAIKFGDKLTKAECMELLKTLSGCKTPFQCAHGRPVMAVVMEIKPNALEYKINIKKILEWKKIRLQ